MRVKSYFLLAVSLCCMLPFMAHGADLYEENPPPPGPRVRSMPISPITINAESGMLTLQFMSDLGEVYVILQPAAKKTNYFQSVNTSIQDQAVFAVPAGIYTLIITDAFGNVIQQENIIIT
ncbi:MAG: hypothetical protein LBV72_07770 [Tannerella sp.]|jgi:hypothetical protein|nr:hypothetical protein [Tannerella sp.]